MDPTAARTDFDAWKRTVPEFIFDFRHSFPPRQRKVLDFTLKSLDFVEAWILDRYSSTDAMLDSDEASVVNWVACYIGETYRKLLGGGWQIRMEDPRDAYFSLPVIVHGEEVICPLTLATATADRRSGNYLRGVFENALADS